MKKTVTLIAVVLVMFGISSTQIISGPLKPPLGYSGAPGEHYCTACHTGTSLNGGGGNVTLSFSGENNVYEPGHTYTVTVTVNDTSESPLCGFETTTLKQNGTNAGKPKIITPENTLIRRSETNGRVYVTNYQGPPYNQWSYKWKAPMGNAGPITIYATGNATDNDFTPQGDHVYATSLTLTAGSPLKESLNPLGNDFEIYPTLIHSQFNLRYQLLEAGDVEIELYDLNGQARETFFKGHQEAGSYKPFLTLQKSYPAGIYLVVFRFADTTMLKKVILQ